MHLRIDAIEQQLRDSGAVTREMNDAGYRAAYATAETELRSGRTVIADCVNPIGLTRDAWLKVAERAGVAVVEVELVCSDAQAHRRRVETREADIPGFTLPAWSEVLTREYQPWPRPRVVVDTAQQSVTECVTAIRDAMETLRH